MTDLHHLIAQGENSALEFKSAGVSTDALAKEMVAFANAQFEEIGEEFVVILPLV